MPSARVFGLAIILITTSILFAIRPAFAAGEPPCAPKFQTLGHEGANWASDLDRLVAFETEIGTAEKTVRDQIQKLELPPRESVQLATRKHLEITDLQTQYNVVAEDVLSEDPVRLANFEHQLSELRNRLEKVLDVRAPTKEATYDINALIEKPELARPGVKYEVPQAATVSGIASSQRMSVQFAREVTDYFGSNSQRAAQFMRAVHKGYVPGASGSGIVRITDHHEALVEIKVVGGNKTRLIGCRRADGFIEILKVYEKRNEGGGGSLKRFAELCD